METFKIGICEADHFSQNAIQKLSTIGLVSTFKGDDLKNFIQDKDIIFIRLKYLLNDELLGNKQKLKYVCSPTTGLNHIQITKPSVKIISLKGEYKFLSTIRATPEHVFGLSLALLRNYPHAFLNENNSIFNRDLYRGYELYKNKVGIIGLGRIGNILAGYYSAFGAEVGYFDVEKKSNTVANFYDSREALIQNSNIIILAANYIKKNEKMLDDKDFVWMKDKYFINAARGELVNETDLLKRLHENWFKGVAIDVIANETQNPIILNEFFKLTKTQNLIITPHIGGATYTSMNRTEDFIVEKLFKELFK